MHAEIARTHTEMHACTHEAATCMLIDARIFRLATLGLYPTPDPRHNPWQQTLSGMHCAGIHGYC